MQVAACSHPFSGTWPPPILILTVPSSSAPCPLPSPSRTQSCDESGLCTVVHSGVNTLAVQWLLGRVSWHRQRSAAKPAADIFRLGVVYLNFPGATLINTIIQYNDLAGLSSCERAASKATVSAAAAFPAELLPADLAITELISVAEEATAEGRRRLQETSELRQKTAHAISQLRRTWRSSSSGGGGRHFTSDTVQHVLRKLTPDAEL